MDSIIPLSLSAEIEKMPDNSGVVCISVIRQPGNIAATPYCAALIGVDLSNSLDELTARPERQVRQH
jgi:hypothetical protein